MIGLALATFSLIMALTAMQMNFLTQSLDYRTLAVQAFILGDYVMVERYQRQAKRVRRFGWPLSVLLPSQRWAQDQGLLDWWPDKPPISEPPISGA